MRWNHRIIWQVALVTVTLAVATVIRTFCFTYSGEVVVAKLRNDLYRSLVQQEVAFFDTSRTGTPWPTPCPGPIQSAPCALHLCESLKS